MITDLKQLTVGSRLNECLSLDLIKLVIINELRSSCLFPGVSERLSGIVLDFNMKLLKTVT